MLCNQLQRMSIPTTQLIAYVLDNLEFGDKSKMYPLMTYLVSLHVFPVRMKAFHHQLITHTLLAALQTNHL
jgi:hypothetical protein